LQLDNSQRGKLCKQLSEKAIAIAEGNIALHVGFSSNNPAKKAV
jgi:hypothetical protein